MTEEELNNLSKELYNELLSVPLYDYDKRKEVIKNFLKRHLTKLV